jgi:2-polyprenyl-6-hydroxyphenyl methylase/3-demethylubiquinone-9 3-methyltransferase
MTLGTFDVVYSWGVLHHTGSMWEGLGNILIPLRRPGGTLYLSIYNQLRYWTEVHRRLKRTYVRAPRVGKAAILSGFAGYQLVKGLLVDLLFGRNPMARYREKKLSRGMSTWHDWVDWVGGYPFETAKPEEIFHFYTARGLVLSNLITCGNGHGCNEYVFRAQSAEVRE